MEVEMLLTPLAFAAPPSIDTPLRTGAKAAADAAVVIGIERYPLLGRDVPYAEADAQAMADTFVYTRGIPLGRVSLLTGTATREDILAAVRELGTAVGPGGTLFVYFAGHGAAAGTTRALLGADVKATTESFAANGVLTTELSRLGAAGGGRVVMLVDACFGGAARDGAELLPGTRWAVPVDTDAGQWAATVENQVAGPLPEAGHGLFTYLAVGAMRGWADGELSGRRDGTVTADEAQAWVVSTLRTMGRTGQTPKLAPDLDGFALTVGVKEAVEGSAFAALRRGTGEAAPALAVGSAAGSSVSTSGGSFGDLSLDVTAKLRQQECDQEAMRLGAAARAARLEVEVKRAAGEASAAWAKLSGPAKACEALDAASRTECAKTVDAFVGRAEGLKVTLTAGEEAVTTNCGAARPAFGAERRTVTVPELGEAKAQSGRLKAVVTAPVKAAAVTTTPTATDPLVDTGTPGFGDEVVTIPGGTFSMGTPTTEKGRSSDETQHKVTLSSFQMARTEVSQALWTKVMGKNPSVAEYEGVSLVGEKLPVQNVSWCDAVDFANRLSRQQGLGEVYAGVAECATTKGVSVTTRAGAAGWRLPTEAEWEYAARAGSSGAWGAVTEEGAVCGIGNVNDVSAKSKFEWRSTAFACDDGVAGSTPVGSYRPNAWGLYDLTGNVWEWAWDWYGDYPGGTATNPTGAPSGSNRVIRGGSWIYEPANSRVGNRLGFTPVYRWSNLGLRLARSLP